MPTFRLTVEEWSRYRSRNASRRKALESLYARRDAVDELIRSLENYQRSSVPGRAECVPFSAGEKCS
jgi:hypothetical protein